MKLTLGARDHHAYALILHWFHILIFNSFIRTFFVFSFLAGTYMECFFRWLLTQQLFFCSYAQRLLCTHSHVDLTWHLNKRLFEVCMNRKKNFNQNIVIICRRTEQIASNRCNDGERNSQEKYRMNSTNICLSVEDCFVSSAFFLSTDRVVRCAFIRLHKFATSCLLFGQIPFCSIRCCLSHLVFFRVYAWGIMRNA